MGLLDFKDDWGKRGWITTFVYFLIWTLYIAWKSGFFGDPKSAGTDYEEKDETLPRIIPVYAEEGVGIQLLAFILWVVVAFIIWIFGSNVIMGKEIEIGNKYIIAIIGQLICILIYIIGYSRVSKFFTENEEGGGSVKWDEDKWGTPLQDAPYDPATWWRIICITLALNILAPHKYIYDKTEDKYKKYVRISSIVIFILGFIIYLIVGPGLGDETKFNPDDKDSVQLDDVAQTVFSLSSLGVIGFLVSKSVGDGADTKYLKFIIPVIAGYWFVNLLIFKMRNRPKDLDETAEKSPAHPVMMADNWFDNENVKFNLYEDVEEGIQYENYWLPMSNSFLNLSGISYLIFYIALVLVPTFIMKKTEYRSGWLVFSSLIIPLCVLISNKAIAAGTREEEYTHLSSLDLYTNFVRGTHKDWDMDVYNFVDVVRLIVRLFIFVVMYGGPIYWVYNNWSKPLNFAAILAWVITFPIILSKLISHDCILSGDKKLLELRKDNDDENFSDKQWQLAFHQHGGLVTMVTLCVIGLLIINYK